MLDAIRAGLAIDPRAIVLDMTRVQLADTAGLGTLVSALHLAHERGVPVAFAGASGRPRILLQRIHSIGMPRSMIRPVRARWVPV